MLETKFRNCRVVLRLKCAFEHTDGTHIAAGFEQRVANRTRSSVCRFHSPRPGLESNSFVSQPCSRVYTGSAYLEISESGYNSSFAGLPPIRWLQSLGANSSSSRS
jgi:hypothetical protein